MRDYIVTLTVQHAQQIEADSEAEAVDLAIGNLPPNIQLDLLALENHEDADVTWDADMIDPIQAREEYRADNSPKKGEEE